MSTTTDPRPGVPPYVPFATFETFLSQLRALSELPARVDRSVMGKFGGSAQGQILAGLRVLGLIQEDGSVTPSLAELVRASGSEQWPAAVETHILPVYERLMTELEFARATPAQLAAEFGRIYGASGSTKTRALRFMFAALRAAGRDVPELLDKHKAKAATGASPRTRRRANRTAAGSGEGAPGGADQPAPEGFFDWRVKLPGVTEPALLRLPLAMTQQQWKVLEAMVEVLKNSSMPDE